MKSPTAEVKDRLEVCKHKLRKSLNNCAAMPHSKCNSGSQHRRRARKAKLDCNGYSTQIHSYCFDTQECPFLDPTPPWHSVWDYWVCSSLQILMLGLGKREAMLAVTRISAWYESYWKDFHYWVIWLLSLHDSLWLLSQEGSFEMWVSRSNYKLLFKGRSD